MGRILLCLLLALTAAQLRQREDASRRRPPSKPPLLRVLPPGNTVALAAGTLTGSKGETLTTNRASTKTCVNASGVLVTLSSNQPCVEAAGLLVEPAATNLALKAEKLDNGVWQKANAPVGSTNDVTVADPYGTNLAERIDYAAVTGTNQDATIYQQISTVTAGAGAYSMQAKMRVLSGTATTYLYMQDGTNVKGTLAASLTSTWQRFCLANVTLTASANSFFHIGVERSVAGGFSAVMANQPAQSIYISQVHVEKGSTCTSYIPTDATAVTRVADVVSAGSLVLGGTPSIGATAVLNGPANDSILVQAYDSVSNSRLQMYAQFVDSKIQCSGTSGGASQGFVISGAAVVVGTPFRASCTYDGARYTVCLNGTCNSSGAVPGPGATTFPKLNLGNSTTFALGMLTGHLQSVCANNRGNSCL